MIGLLGFFVVVKLGPTTSGQVPVVGRSFSKIQMKVWLLWLCVWLDPSAIPLHLV